jgi:collagenase-like PrtC family protease
MTPRLATYVHDADTITAAIKASATSLVVDDPRVSVRCWDAASGNHAADDFSQLAQLASAARFLAPDIELILNADKLCRDHQLPLIRAACIAAAAAGYDAIRVLDGGLIDPLKEAAPGLRYELATEMGNCCFASVSAYAKEGFNHMVLSNDWPAADITALQHAIADGTVPPLTLEILVHGPMLLQYSDRRQLTAGLIEKSTTSAPTASRDPDQLPATGWRCVDVDGRAYPFADNQHGAFMYNTFDRGLFGSAELLRQCKLSRWLIDGRGQSPAYTSTALHAYAALLEADDTADEGERTSTSTHAELWSAVTAASERAFKPGFFHANNTDHCFEDLATAHADTHTYGEAIDVQRGEKITILLQDALPSEDRALAALRLHTPEGRVIELDWSKLSDAIDSPLRPQAAQAGQVIRLPWRKGAICASILR